MAQRLINPRYGHRRTYWVQVEGIPTAEALDTLASGVEIKGQRTRLAIAITIPDPQLPERSVPIRYRSSIATTWLSLTLTEGRNRQVRRMTAAVGLPTLRLIRVAIANLELADLAPGQWRDLSTRELQRLRQSLQRGQ